MAKIPDEVLQELYNNLTKLGSKDPIRHQLVQRTAKAFNCCEQTVYFQLKKWPLPKRANRKDKGHCRYEVELEFRQWIEIVAALKLASLNKKGRHLSTTRAIELAEAGVYIDGKLKQIPKGVLNRVTADRWMQQLGINIVGSMKQSACVRFQAQQSNECWQFDISISDAYYLAQQKSLTPAQQETYPHLALFSVVDDYSRINYQEYFLVYGEEVEAALLFLFHAMAAKEEPSFPFQGIPQSLYMDNGPLSKSRVFLRVMEKLGIEIKLHQTPVQSGRKRVAARSKGKVERCFRAVKESFEVLFHFHKPETVNEANLWLMKHLLHYNCQQHPTKKLSRLETWTQGLASEGFRQMCNWQTYCMFAREGEIRTVALDCSVSVDNKSYITIPELVGEKVEVWKGIFDNSLYVKDQSGNIYGPFTSKDSTIEFNTYRRWRKTEQEKRVEKVEELAAHISIGRENFLIDRRTEEQKNTQFQLASTPFVNPVGLLPDSYTSAKEARRGIFQQFGIPLGQLSDEVLEEINFILSQTLNRREIYQRIKHLFKQFSLGG